MPDITINLSQQEYDAMTVMPNVTPEEWVQHAASNKARKLIDVLVTDYTDKNPAKMSKADKEAVIPTIDLEKEKDKRKGK